MSNLEPYDFGIELPSALASAREAIETVQQITILLDELRSSNSTDTQGLTLLRVVIAKLVDDLRAVDRAAESNLWDSMEERIVHVEGVGSVEKSSGMVWDNKAWEIEKIKTAIGVKVNEAFLEGEILNPEEAGVLGATLALAIGGSSLRTTAMKAIDLNPEDIGKREQKRRTVTMPKTLKKEIGS